MDEFSYIQHINSLTLCLFGVIQELKEKRWRANGDDMGFQLWLKVI